MFLTKDEVTFILQKPFFSAPVTESDKEYMFYRHRTNIHLYTVRFNLTPTFSVNRMLATLQISLFQRFPVESLLHVSIMHDLLLCSDPRAEPESFYIWRANTNRHVIDDNNEDHHEFEMNLSQYNVIKLCHSVLQMNPDDFNPYFVNSSVTVDRVLSLVLTFEGPRIDTGS
jgi:hypothetical protein